MAKPGAQFIRQYLKTYKTYRGHVPLYNGDKMAHRTWELYPHTIRIDTRLQVCACVGGGQGGEGGGVCVCMCAHARSCMCVRACVRAHARVCVCVCV